jgi:two-component system LytT family response regulator
LQHKDGDFVYLPNTANGWVVRVSEIGLLEALGNYTRVILSDGRKILLRRSMTNCERDLSETRRFFRTSRSCIVNLEWVKKTRPADPKHITFVLEGGKEVTLSRQRTVALRREYAL